MGSQLIAGTKEDRSKSHYDPAWHGGHAYLQSKGILSIPKRKPEIIISKIIQLLKYKLKQLKEK